MPALRDHGLSAGAAVSRPEVVDEAALRASLVAVLCEAPGAPGSLYLRTLVCAYLACDAESDAEKLALETLYKEQARVEGVDDVELLNDIDADRLGAKG